MFKFNHAALNDHVRSFSMANCCVLKWCSLLAVLCQH